MATKAQVKAALNGVMALAKAVRELGQVPNGLLYSQVMGVMDFDSYVRSIDMLKRTGLVEEEFHVLHWRGPQPATKEETTV